MRRNWDHIRTILLYVEAREGETLPDLRCRIDDIGPRGQVDMMVSGGLLKITRFERVAILTEYGREFLDTVRHPMVWKSCKRAIEANAGGLPSDMLLSTARSAMRWLVQEA